LRVSRQNRKVPSTFPVFLSISDERRLRSTLQSLSDIADKNGGNRAAGYPGEKASVDFVLERTKRLSNKFDTYLQKFPITHYEEHAFSLRLGGPNGTEIPSGGAKFNPSTPPGGITAPLLNTPIDDANGSMCLESHWKGIDAKGKIALIKRGGCAASNKLIHARAKGALGVVMYHHIPETLFITPNLNATDPKTQLVPVAIIAYKSGVELATALDAGKQLNVTLLVNTTVETRESWNVISQTKAGNPDIVLMLGAHIDSVPTGPGINDDGTGTSALLNIMESIAQYDSHNQSIRLAWWGAEEIGLLGSLFYTHNLTSPEADKIRTYINLDMIGSPVPKFEIGRTLASGPAKKLLEDFLGAQGKPVTFDGFEGNSDFDGFLKLGIPTVGLFTGAEAPFDECYHKACDNMNNVNWEALTINTKAAAHTIGALANAGALELPGRMHTSTNWRRRSNMASNFKRWKTLAARATSHHHTCSHGRGGSAV